MDDKELYNKFKRYCDEHGWTFDESAKNIGFGRSSLFNWQNGAPISKKARVAMLALIAELPQSGNAHILTKAEMANDRRVPLLTMAQAAQLGANTNCQPDIEPGEMVTFMHAEPEDFAMTVSGHSMEPWYPAGTRLLVKRNRKPQTGNRVAAMLEGRSDPIFKNYVDLGGKFVLLSINEKDGLPPIELDKMDKGETWYWVYPIGESVRDEFALDECMKKHGIRHFWEDKIEELKNV